MRPSNISVAHLEVRAVVSEDREEPKEGGGCCSQSFQREDPQLWCFEHQNAVNGVRGGFVSALSTFTFILHIGFAYEKTN